MRMRAITIGKDREAQFSIAVPQEKCGVAGNASTVSEIAIAIAHLYPPCQTESRGFVSPDTFDWPLELIELAGEHLLHGLLTDYSFPFEHSAIEVSDQP